MSTTRRPNWWPYVLNSLRDYPEIHRELEAARSTSMTAAYTGMPSGGGTSDPVFMAATRRGSVTEDEERMHDAIESALLQTKQERNWRTRIRLVELVYFRKTRTISGAADEVHYSYIHTKRMLDEFIHLVARNRGLEDGPSENQK